MALRQFNLFRKIPGNVLSLRVAGIMLLAELVIGTLGYCFIEGYTVIEAVYMTVITISTVGFTEVQPLSMAGRAFTAAFILVNIGVFAYLLAAFSYYVIDGKIFKVMQAERAKRRIDQLTNHIIICGFGKYGREIAENLDRHRQSFVIIEMEEEVIQAAPAADEDFLYVHGDATHDEILQEAGIERATGLISALRDDSDNLFIVLSARVLNPRLRIVSRSQEPRSRNKLVKAGANHVIMPEQIGGFYMATLLSKPGAVEFFSFITNELEADVAFEEVTYDRLPERYRGKAILDLHLRRDTGVNIVGHRSRQGRYQVNPDPSIVLQPGDSFITLGSQGQIDALIGWLEEGREV